MALGGDIENRIGDLIGSTFNADVGYAGDLINAAINEIADTISEDLLLKYSRNPGALTEASEWLVEDRKILKVTRVDANSGGIERECQPLDRTAFAAAQDTTSLYFATKISPVYHLDSKNAGAATLKIIPVCNANGQEGRIWYYQYVADGTDTTALTQATLNTTYNLPNECIHALVLKASINILGAYISTQVQDEEDEELLRMIQVQKQNLEKSYQEEIARFMDEAGKPGGE